MVHHGYLNLLWAAKKCLSSPERTVFAILHESVGWCFLCYNHVFGHRHIKLYSSIDIVIAQLVKRN